MATATPTTRPTLADAFEALANVEIEQQDTDLVQVKVPAIQDALKPLTAHLNELGRDLWWGELKRCMIARQKTAGMGPTCDTAGVDWDDRVADALDVLTGGDPR